QPEAFLAAGDDAVNAPLVHAHLVRAKGGDAVDDDQALEALPDIGNELPDIVVSAGRSLIRLQKERFRIAFAFHEVEDRRRSWRGAPRNLQRRDVAAVGARQL